MKGVPGCIRMALCLVISCGSGLSMLVVQGLLTLQRK